MSGEEAKLNGRPAVIERLRPLANAIVRGEYPEPPTQEQQAQLAEMVSQGMYIFPKLSDEERIGIRHTSKMQATYLGAFLYKHARLSPHAASIAAQRCLFPSTRRKGKPHEEPWKSGWVD